jgi:hypothetical protein
MKKEKGKMTDQQVISQGKLKEFANEYLTQKNILVSLGVASLAGVATYSTVRALKNERLVNRIKKELNFDHLKENVNSTIKGLGIFGKKGSKTQAQERGPVKQPAKSGPVKGKSNKFTKA